jgi:hypothetical protein
MPLAAKKGHNGRKTCAKNGNSMSIKHANWASDHACKSTSQSQKPCTYGCRPLAETKECHGCVLRGRGCFTMSELSSTVGGWVGCGNFMANAESGISGPQSTVVPLGTDAFALDAFQTDCSSVDNLRAGSKSRRPTS